MHPIKRQMNSTHARVKVSHVPILFSIGRAFCLLDETKSKKLVGFLHRYVIAWSHFPSAMKIKTFDRYRNLVNLKYTLPWNLGDDDIAART